MTPHSPGILGLETIKNSDHEENNYPTIRTDFAHRM